jgi:CheY-like chemotaxis protein
MPPPPPPRALLVDDSEIALRFLESRLQRWGMVMDRAAGSSKAIELLARRDYDFVFLDLELGPESEMDGLALCQHIKRNQSANAAIGSSVFIVSAHQTELDRVRASLAGCDAYLGKPLQELDLRRLLLRHGLQSPAEEACHATTRCLAERQPQPRAESSVAPTIKAPPSASGSVNVPAPSSTALSRREQHLGDHDHRRHIGRQARSAVLQRQVAHQERRGHGQAAQHPAWRGGRQRPAPALAWPACASTPATRVPPRNMASARAASGWCASRRSITLFKREGEARPPHPGPRPGCVAAAGRLRVATARWPRPPAPWPRAAMAARVMRSPSSSRASSTAHSGIR